VAGSDRNLVRPKKFKQDPLRIVAGSPLAIQGVFLEILRERFNEQSGLHLTWRDDWTTTDILIETAYNEEVEARNKVPALYVYRLQTVPSMQVIANRVGVRLNDHLEGNVALNTVAMMIECVSNDEGESALLGDLIQFTLLCSRDPISDAFGFYDLSMPTLGQTTPLQRDQTKWVTPVEFSVQFYVRWQHVPIAPLLQQIAQRITSQSQTPEDHFVEVTLNSLRRGEETVELQPVPETASFSFDKATATTKTPAPVPVEPLPTPIPADVYLTDQALAGELDGSNRVFSTVVPFLRDDTKREAVYINGLRMTPGDDSDYLVKKSSPAVTGYDTIELAYAPHEGDTLTIDFYAIGEGLSD